MAVTSPFLLLSLYLFSFFQYLPSVSSQACPNGCNLHGRCSYPGRQCECFAGYLGVDPVTNMGGDCSLLSCPKGIAWSGGFANDINNPVGNAHGLVECSNMGICDRTTGTCTCRLGFEGKACERTSCPNGCNGVGKCQSLYYYAQTKDPGLLSADGLSHVYPYSTNWDANKIYGCNCDDGYFGPQCIDRSCPTGDDPLTGNSANTPSNPIQYNEVQMVVCKAGGGSFTLTFRGKTTVSIPYNAKAAQIQAAIEALTTVGAGNTKIVMFGSQACLDTGTKWTVEFLQNFGSLPLMVPDSSLLFFSNALVKPLLTVGKQQDGTKENAECSNRGICDHTTGICACSTNFDTSNGYNLPGTRGDCGYATRTIQYCPGTVSCSAHGQCAGNPTYKCICSDGWTGADCSERICPMGVSWFNYPTGANVAHVFESVECSDMGECDRSSGLCTCVSGFTGSACEYLTCPGTPDLCNAHGECLDMNTLAKRQLVNGVLPTSFIPPLPLFSYGDTPNNPLTWDATKIYGCLCDEGYTGYDCSQRTCPLGDDPGTTDQADEQQMITCTDADSTGTLSFTFREKTTTVLTMSPSNPATVSMVKAALEGLPNIGKVNVDVYDTSDPNSLCTSKGGKFIVTFLTEHGDLPLLTYNKNGIDSVDVMETVMGTKESWECSGRGICSLSQGVCTCFTGYGSSDGQGGPGTLNDCGYIEPLGGAPAA